MFYQFSESVAMFYQFEKSIVSVKLNRMLIWFMNGDRAP